MKSEAQINSKIRELDGQRLRIENCPKEIIERGWLIPSLNGQISALKWVLSDD